MLVSAKSIKFRKTTNEGLPCKYKVTAFIENNEGIIIVKKIFLSSESDNYGKIRKYKNIYCIQQEIVFRYLTLLNIADISSHLLSLLKTV